MKGLENERGFSKDAYILIAVNSLFGLGNGLSGMFVNVYLWKLNSQLTMVAWFNLWMFIGVLFTFPIAAWFSKRWDRKWTIQLGFLGYALFYGIVLLLGQDTIRYLIWLGLAQGIGVSFYACAYHILTYDLTHNLNRDRFFAWIGTIGSALGLLTPVLSGWMIAKGEGLSGYYLTFSITLGLFLAAMILSLFFNKDGQQERFQLMDALLPTQKVHDWNRVLISQGLLGLRDGVFSFLVTMLLFFVFQNEFNMGKYTVLLSVIGMVATYTIGRIINHRNRLQAILIGGVMITLSTVAVAVSGNPVSVLLFTLAGAVFNPLWSIPFGSITFQVIDRMPDAATKRIEYISVREIPLGIGRIISLVLFLLIADQLKDEISIRLGVLLIGTMLIGVWWVLRGIATEQRTVEEHHGTRYPLSLRNECPSRKKGK